MYNITFLISFARNCQLSFHK